MGRLLTLIGIWLVGYALGFIGFLGIPALGDWLLSILPNVILIETIVGATISGLVSSLIVTSLVIVWAKVSR